MTSHELRAFRGLEALSFVHSAIYTALLVLWLSGSESELKTALGWAHGIMWIVMYCLVVVAAGRRIVPFWLAVTVAVVGGLGPFAGTAGFVIQDGRISHARKAAGLSGR